MAIAEISIDVVASLARFREDMATVGKTVTDQMRQVNESIESVKGSFEALRGALELVGISFGIKEIADFVKGTIEATAAIKDQADEIGVSTQAFQALQYAASQTGTSQEVLGKGIATLTKNIGLAADGAKQQSDVFKSLGIDVRDASGNIKSTEAVFLEVADAVDKIQSPAERARVEVELLGKSGQQMGSMLEGGSASLQGFAAQAENLGLVFDSGMIKQAQEAQAKLQGLSLEFDALADRLVAKVIPYLEHFLADLEKIPALAPDPAIAATNQKIDELTKTLAAQQAQLEQSKWAEDNYLGWITSVAGSSTTEMIARIKATTEALQDQEEVARILQAGKNSQTSSIFSAPATTGSAGLKGALAPTGKSQAQIDAEAMAAEVAALKAETETLAGNSDAQKLNSALVAAHAKAGSEDAATITRMVEGIQGMTQAQEADKKAWKEHTDEVKAADELMRSLEPKVDKLAEDQALLNKYLKDGVITQAEYTKASANVKTAIDAQDTATKRFNKSLTDMASDMTNDLGSAMADLATGATTWQAALSSALRTVLNDVLKLIDASTGKSGGGGLLSILGNIGESILGSVFGGGGSVAAAAAPVAFGSHAAGGHMAAGELGLVGERGAELWLPDVPGTIIPNTVSDAMMSGGMGGPTYNIDARGADSAAIARLEATLRELHRSIEPRAVAAVGAARKRGGTFAALFAR